MEQDIFLAWHIKELRKLVYCKGTNVMENKENYECNMDSFSIDTEIILLHFYMVNIYFEEKKSRPTLST